VRGSRDAWREVEPDAELQAARRGGGRRHAEAGRHDAIVVLPVRAVGDVEGLYGTIVAPATALSDGSWTTPVIEAVTD